MFKLLIRVALHFDFSAVIRAAIRLEYGAGVFCRKQSIRAYEENLFNLAAYLKKQFAEEDAHARMLGGILDGSSRLKRNCPGGSASYINGYEPLEGISQRYWAAKLFFWFGSPEEFTWADTLAFMYVAELFVIAFYEALIDFLHSCTRDQGSENFDFCLSLLAITRKIHLDEVEQAEILKLFLTELHPYPDVVIGKWRHRSTLAFLGAIFDISAGLGKA